LYYKPRIHKKCIVYFYFENNYRRIIFLLVKVKAALLKLRLIYFNDKNETAIRYCFIKYFYIDKISDIFKYQ